MERSPAWQEDVAHRQVPEIANCTITKRHACRVLLDTAELWKVYYDTGQLRVSFSYMPRWELRNSRKQFEARLHVYALRNYVTNACELRRYTRNCIGYITSEPNDQATPLHPNIHG